MDIDRTASSISPSDAQNRPDEGAEASAASQDRVDGSSMAVDGEDEMPGDAVDRTGAKGKGGRGGGSVGRGGKVAGRGGAKSAGSGTGKAKATKEGGGATAAGPSFPLARVSRIVKIDRDVENTSKDAIWAIAAATEQFVKHLTDSAITKARLDKKKVVTYKELALAVETQPEFFFLNEVIPQTMPLGQAFGLRRELEEENRARAVGLLIDEESEEEVEDEADDVEGETGVEVTQSETADVSRKSSSKASKGGSTANGKTKASKSRQVDAEEDASAPDVVGQLSSSSTKPRKLAKKPSAKALKSRATTEAADEEMADV